MPYVRKRSIVETWKRWAGEDGGDPTFTSLADVDITAPMTADSYLVIDANGNLVETTDPVIKSETGEQVIQGTLQSGIGFALSPAFSLVLDTTGAGTMSSFLFMADDGVDFEERAHARWDETNTLLEFIVRNSTDATDVSGLRVGRTGGSTPTEPQYYDGSSWVDIFHDSTADGGIPAAMIPLTSSWMLRGNVSNVAQAVDFLNTNLGWGGIQTYAALSTFNGAADFGSTVTMTSGGHYATGVLYLDALNEIRATDDITWSGAKFTFGHPHSNVGVFRVSNPIDATSTALYIEAHKNTLTKSARLVMRSSEGTAASPSFLSAGAYMGAIEFGGYHSGSGWADSVEMYAVADEAPTGSARGSSLRFHTASIGTTTLTERMRIHSNGLVGIGVTAPTSQLHVNADITLDDADAGSLLSWGSAGDTSLYRDSAAHLKTDESLEVAEDFFHSDSAADFGIFGVGPNPQPAAYTRNATVVEDRTLLASASATTLNNNNVLAALIADLQSLGIVQ